MKGTLDTAIKDSVAYMESMLEKQQDFIQSWNHEIGNPLGFITGGLSELEIAYKEGKDISQFIEWIRIGSIQLEGMNENIRNSKEGMEEQLTGKAITLREWMKGLAGAHSVTAKIKRVSIELFISKLAPVIFYNDQTRLTQVVSNMISNAVKFSQEGDTVNIGLIVDSDNNLRIKVTDYGVGIAKEQIPIIFDKFQRLNKKIPGSGIGLSVVEKYVAMMKGRIIVKSEVNAGTDIEIVLPIVGHSQCA